MSSDALMDVAVPPLPSWSLNRDEQQAAMDRREPRA